MWLVRPYPTERLEAARDAIAAVAAGDVAPLMRLYTEAAEALAAIDPDEVEDLRSEHPRADTVDRAAARAAVDVADTWEGIVAVGSTIADPKRFRGFAVLAAQVRYGLGPGNPDIGRLLAYGKGQPLPRTSAEDTALFAALPALLGLGPELPDEVAAPCPAEGTPVAAILGLPDDAVEGIDPLDGVAVSAAACRSAYAGADGAWREILARGCEAGLLLRRED